MQSYRDGKNAFPDGSIIARLAWSLDASPANDAVFGQKQSFVAGAPKNGLQFIVKDAKKYAATGGWGYGQVRRRQVRGSVGARNVLRLPPGHEEPRLRLHALRAVRRDGEAVAS